MDPEKRVIETDKQQSINHDVAEAQATGTHLPAHGHNASSQRDVAPNPNLALHNSNEHEHEHLHHHKRSIQGRDDEVVYSHGHNPEKSNVPDQITHDGHHAPQYTESKTAGKSGVIQSDAEKGILSPGSLSQEEDDPRSHKLSGFYARRKIFFHAAFLALMTGYATFSTHLPLHVF